MNRTTSPFRRLAALFSLAVLTGTTAAASAPPLAGERVLWLGDSITQAGDYVTFTEYYLNRTYSEHTWDIVSIGRSSETTSELSEKSHPGRRPSIHDRLPRALELLKPRIVIACYGMNDGIYHPQSPERLQAFQVGIRRLIAAAKAAGARVILLGPPPFDPRSSRNLQPATAPEFGYSLPYENYDSVLADYARWETTLSPGEAGAIDLHSPMNAGLVERRKTNPAFTFSPDGVHPDATGHLLMARIILQGLGVPLPAADLPAELARIQADPLYPLVKTRRETRSNAWLVYVGLPGAVERAELDAATLQKAIDGIRNPAAAASTTAPVRP